VDTGLDALATALYVEVDDFVTHHPELVPWRPTVGIKPQVSDAELVTLAVLAVLMRFDNETHWVRHARTRLSHLFPYLPQQSGYNKRMRKLVMLMAAVMQHLATTTSVFTDDLVVADSTPVECGRSRETAKRSDLAGFAEYGYCASHSRYFWGLRLHLIATVHGLPLAFSITGAKADERQVLLQMIDTPALTMVPGRTIAADKNYYGHDFEETLTTRGFHLLRKARTTEQPRPGARLLKPIRQVIESIFDTLKDQLGLERHGGRTPAGVITRIVQRLLALTAVIWHNDRTGQPVLRSLTAYDH
jgi:DDE family transposase